MVSLRTSAFVAISNEVLPYRIKYKIVLNKNRLTLIFCNQCNHNYKGDLNNFGNCT